MSTPPLVKTSYNSLNSKGKESYNFQKLSAILADYGFTTLKLNDDWQGADFIAVHSNGEDFLKIQLKGVLCVDKKYFGKHIWMAFRKGSDWYMFNHDAFLNWCLDPINTNIRNTKDWAFDATGKLQAGSRTIAATWVVAT